MSPSIMRPPGVCTSPLKCVRQVSGSPPMGLNFTTSFNCTSAAV
jgi:hypothetical protein